MPTVWLAPVAFVFGLAIGSFMTVVAARVPAGESVVSPRSRCPHCGAEIRNRDNIPVLGWIMLRGRCHNCGARISARYPLLELSTAILMAAPFFVYDSVWVACGVSALLALMPVISVIDLEHRIIPNRIVYPALIAFPIYLVVANLFGAPVDLVRMVIGFAAYGGILFVVALISRGMGMGDVKLAALIGLVLGSLSLGQVAVAAGAAIILGAIGAVAALARGAGRKGAIPFGPFLAAGAVVAALWGVQLADWYQRTFLHV
ncbi:MAG TPA: prepilin peptidase [Actinomycetota bacterium]|nr:prepilin peptidase [Actinomycetota bacterium]